MSKISDALLEYVDQLKQQKSRQDLAKLVKGEIAVADFRAKPAWFVSLLPNLYKEIETVFATERPISQEDIPCLKHFLDAYNSKNSFNPPIPYPTPRLIQEECGSILNMLEKEITGKSQGGCQLM